MKKLFAGLLLAALFTACNSSESTTDEDAKTAPVTPGIDNVDGNIPDTTRAIRLNHPLPKDSGDLADSAGH